MTFESIKSFYSPQEYPALDWQIREWGISRPLAGLKVLDCAPVFRNTVVKYCALIAAGAELTVGISDVMPYDPAIVSFLREQGIKVVHADEEPCSQDIILDCAGAFCAWPARLGVSELTRSGAHVYAGLESGKPVFLADEGRIKRIETCLGTGDGFFRAMEHMGHSGWSGRRIIVFGSGKVGTGIIYQAVKRGAIVDVVTDPSTISPFIRDIVHSVVDFSDTDAVRRIFMQNACPAYPTEVSTTPSEYTDRNTLATHSPKEIKTSASDIYAVVTATGVKGAVESCCHADVVIAGGALLANMGVEDEFGDTFPADAVLNEKRPLNFILEEPTQMRYIETTMALHNQGAVYLASYPASDHKPLSTHPSPDHGELPADKLLSGIIIPPAALEEQLLDIVRTYGLIGHELELIDEVTR